MARAGEWRPFTRVDGALEAETIKTMQRYVIMLAALAEGWIAMPPGMCRFCVCADTGGLRSTHSCLNWENEADLKASGLRAGAGKNACPRQAAWLRLGLRRHKIRQNNDKTIHSLEAAKVV